ncbi:MAG TPA: hypothetical protein VML58_21760 [Burkholderiaceae bacterium]|nr:hypothetical protein [Burkholderiaceae bacterium]
MNWLQLYSIAVRHPRAKGMLSDVAATAVLDSNNEALSREVLSQSQDSLRVVCELLDKHAVPLPPATVDLVGGMSTRGPRTSRGSETSR